MKRSTWLQIQKRIKTESTTSVLKDMKIKPHIYYYWNARFLKKDKPQSEDKPKRKRTKSIDKLPIGIHNAKIVRTRIVGNRILVTYQVVKEIYITNESF